MTRVALFLCFVTIALVHGGDHTQQKAPREVLAQFAGTWEMHQDEMTGERSECASIIMGGRFVESRTWLPDNCFKKITTVTLMTYDEKLKSYRAWISWSNGEDWEATGEWDAESQTMTWTAPTRTGTRVFRSRFIDGSKREWSIEDFDANGKQGWGTKGFAKRAIETTP